MRGVRDKGQGDTNSKSSPEGAFGNLAWGGNPRRLNHGLVYSERSGE